MGFSNGSNLDQTNLQLALDNTVKGDVSNTYVKSQFDSSNAFTVARFKQQNLELGVEYKFRFLSPDDFDIFMAGLTLRFDAAPTFGTGLEFSCKIQGSIGDLENDLPVDDNLFLTEPVSNVEDQQLLAPLTEVLNDIMYIKAVAGGSQIQHGTRYASYLLNEDRSCNTLLKGASYDVTMKVYQDPTNVANLGPQSENHNLEFFMMLRTKLRKN